MSTGTKKRMGNNESIKKRMEECGIRPTPVRMLVAGTLCEADAPLSLLDIETRLDTAPKSTIFRALTLFEQHHIVHSIEDGSGSLKYEYCNCSDNHTHNEMHTHFYCERCRRTYCLKETQVPDVELPQGFTMHRANYIIKGICAKCKEAE